jgi:K+-transporting ATPase ATPase A chain
LRAAAGVSGGSAAVAGEILVMSANGWFQIGLFLLVIFALTKPIGAYIARVFNGEKTFLDGLMRPLERTLYRLIGVDERHEMRWTEYAIAMLLFSGVSMILLYLIERFQFRLPLNP